jgi:ABC-type transport system involved in multi-copper enzyme maturation permease subunit
MTNPTMLGKIVAIALNTYRENVRARLLHGLFAVATATVGYSLIVGAYAFKDTLRVISDLGSASLSIYGILVAVVLGATSLHRELDLKTAFPILVRPISRSTYLVAKFIGSWLTISAFTMGNCALSLVAVAVLGGAKNQWVLFGVGGLVVGTVILAWQLPRFRTYLPIFVAIASVLMGWVLAGVAPDDRRVLVGSTILSLCEIAIVIAVANLFASFSSPFLTAMLTLGVVIVGRSADTLARLPERIFGNFVANAAKAVAHVVPNLMTYVPARPLLTGELPGSHLISYLGRAGNMSLGWVIILLTLSSLLFNRRDFT